MIITPYQLFQYIMWGGTACLIIIGMIMLFTWIYDNAKDYVRVRSVQVSNLKYDCMRLERELAHYRSLKEKSK